MALCEGFSLLQRRQAASPLVPNPSSLENSKVQNAQYPISSSILSLLAVFVHIYTPDGAGKFLHIASKCDSGFQEITTTTPAVMIIIIWLGIVLTFVS
jgi:hypothetical protein